MILKQVEYILYTLVQMHFSFMAIRRLCIWKQHKNGAIHLHLYKTRRSVQSSSQLTLCPCQQTKSCHLSMSYQFRVWREKTSMKKTKPDGTRTLALPFGSPTDYSLNETPRKVFFYLELRPFQEYFHFIKGGRKLEKLGKNHLTIRKQNLAFPHVTRARLEPQR